MIADPEISGFGVKGGETAGNVSYQSHKIFMKGVIEKHKRRDRL